MFWLVFPVTAADAPNRKLAAAVHQRAQAPGRSSDQEIERDIRARFQKSKISADKFEVHVAGGIATIDGRTDVIQRKGTATRLAKLGGATRVVNRIEISEAARQKAENNLSRGARRAFVKRSEAR